METLSRHFLKRRALARERVEQDKVVAAGNSKAFAASWVFVERAQRGPFRWRVVRR